MCFFGTACSYSSRLGSDSLFWPLLETAHICTCTHRDTVFLIACPVIGVCIQEDSSPPRKQKKPLPVAFLIAIPSSSLLL